MLAEQSRAAAQGELQDLEDEDSTDFSSSHTSGVTSPDASVHGSSSSAGVPPSFAACIYQTYLAAQGTMQLGSTTKVLQNPAHAPTRNQKIVLQEVLWTLKTAIPDRIMQWGAS